METLSDAQVLICGIGCSACPAGAGEHRAGAPLPLDCCFPPFWPASGFSFNSFDS